MSAIDNALLQAQARVHQQAQAVGQAFDALRNRQKARVVVLLGLACGPISLRRLRAADSALGGNFGGYAPELTEHLCRDLASDGVVELREAAGELEVMLRTQGRSPSLGINLQGTITGRVPAAGPSQANVPKAGSGELGVPHCSGHAARTEPPIS
jgi:hypothetical protein